MIMFAPELFPFTIALIILLAIAFIEGVGLIIGLALSSALDTILPDIDIDFDMDGNVISQSGFTKLLGWMNVGRVPALVIIICLLGAFIVSGYLLQGAVYTALGVFLPTYVAIPLAFVGAIPFTRAFTNVMAKIMPTDESSAVSIDDFIGKTAVITIGRALRGSPAEAKLTDSFGQTHYVMVEPKDEEIVFEQGELILIAQKKENSSGFYAIKNNNENLID